MELHLTSPIPPSVNHYLAVRGIMRNGFPTAITYKTKDAVKYQKEFAKYVEDEIRRQSWVSPVNKYQHFYVDQIFYFPRIDMDANNYQKCLLDAITDTKLIWNDDNVVCERIQAIYYDSTNPRIEITIHPVDYIGVFKNASHLEVFTDKCTGCTRYKRNCSLLNKAREGHVQKEIIDGVCSKFKPVKI